jgi:hypothetical protein
MMGKLPKSKAWKQSDPDKTRLLLHPRYLSRNSTCQVHPRDDTYFGVILNFLVIS